jgi:hypothetical protein
VPNPQEKNVGNEGDVMKHAPLQEIVRRICKEKDGFWYVETHASSPFYFLPPKGSWQRGMGQLNAWQQVPARRLPKRYRLLAYHDKQKVPDRFPDDRVYLGSTAQVFHLLRRNKKRVRMTCFETDPEPAEQLLQYFECQGASVVLVQAAEDSGFVAKFLGEWWDKAAMAAGGDDLVMIVQGDSYKLAPSLWENRSEASDPDLVFVDPFKLEDSPGQPNTILASLNKSKVPFMCWTPLNGKTNLGNGTRWTFLEEGVGDAKEFVKFCYDKKLTCAWFSWRASSGQSTYGCQLTFNNLFNCFSATPVWKFGGQPGQLPYLDIGGQVAGSPGLSLQNPKTTWQTWGAPLDANAQRIEYQNHPGEAWYSQYNAALWWP